MLNLIKNSLFILKSNSFLTLPFILYIFIGSLLFYNSMNSSNIFILLGFIILSILITACFISGWCYNIKKNIEIYKKDIDEKEKQIEMFKSSNNFISGVGAYFFKVLLTIILYLIFLFLFLYFISFIGAKIIGPIAINLNELSKVMYSQSDLTTYLNNLKPNEITNLTKWVILFSTSSFLYHYITLFWFCDLFYCNNNPITSLFASIKFNFKNFIITFTIFIIITVLNAIVSILNGLTASNIILGTIALLLLAYFTTYIVILLFLTYDEKNYCTNRSNSIREN